MYEKDKYKQLGLQVIQIVLSSYAMLNYSKHRGRERER